MLTVIKDEEEILGVCEWWICDKEGERDKQGKYIWIAELEISKKHQNKWVIKEIINEINKKAGDAEFVYFWRSKYNKRIRLYRREHFLEFAK